MTDDNKPPEHNDSENSEEQKPDPGPTKRLEKAIEDMESGEVAEGTLVDIHAGTSEVPKLGAKGDEASVSKELEKAKGAGGSKTPDVEPAATMYDPTTREHVTGGSDKATMYQPTGSDQHQQPPSGTGYNAQPVAPFGGKIMVGTRIGQIEVTGVLGKGGMGEVFRGYHHALDIDVAIKVLPDELSRNELVRQRFLREARLCVKLDHPHIVRVYNVDEYAGNLYLVMEMIDGTDAAGMLKDGGRFRYKRALEIGAASADALAYAHTQGLVHRDVKPHNILLGAKDGKIKLSDFGLARAATSSSHLTMSGQIMGTPHYMSPEQAESKEVTDKSDVYSLGVTLYHMLTGETPFVGDTPISVAVQHIAKEIIYPEIRFKPFPKELVAVLKRMTAKDAAKRCSAKQAAVWLRKLMSMATDDDIKVDDEQAMKSMAPVVRESQAFQQALKEREQRDNQAREAAQTMLATVQEASARRAAVPETMGEGGSGQVAAAPVAEKKGSGGLIAAVVIVLLLLGGGGGAGWYFTMGPGAPKENGKRNDLIAGDDSGDSDTGSETGGPSDGGPDDGGPSDGGPSDGGPTDGGPDDGGANDGGPDDGGPDDGGEGPPPEVDDPDVAAKLEAADGVITRATSLEEILQAKKSLDLARMELGSASAKQRKEFEDLNAKYERQFAYWAVDDASTKIGEAVELFEGVRADDRESAIKHLNDALAERERLNQLEVPPEAVELVKDTRETAVGQVDEALEEFWGELDAEAKRLEDEDQFAEADKILGDMQKLDVAAERRGKLAERRAIVQTRSRHKLILARLDMKKYADAMELLDEAENAGIPEALKDDHATVANEVTGRIAGVLAGHLEAAEAALDGSDFTLARNELDAAGELPLNSDQAANVADLLFATDLREQLHNAQLAIDAEDFATAREGLDAANDMIEGADARVVPEALTDMYRKVNGDFDAKLSQKFSDLMAAAEADVDEKDFKSAGENLNQADDLPLTEGQRTRLEDFKKTNQEALDNYVRELITAFEQALDDNDFETAKENLETINALPTPEDMAEKLAGLQARFSTEAVSRHTELLEDAQKALDEKDYDDARAALDQAAAIPVADNRRDKELELSDEWLRMLTADVDTHLTEADRLLDEEEFEKAKAEIEAAAALPSTEDTNRRIKRKLGVWNERLEATFDDLLTRAKDAAKAELFKTADALLTKAEELPLSQEQLIRLGTARDELDKLIDGYKDKLFEELEECVEKGLEEEGKKIVKKIEAQTLGPSDQLRLKRLAAALTGETDAARRERLPKHLQGMFNDRYCETEQLINIGEEISALNVTSDGKYGAAGTESGKVYFYNLKRGTRVGSSTGGRRRITSIALSQDGSKAVAGNDDGDLVLFTIKGTSVSTRSLANAGDDVMGMAFSPNGNVLYVATRDGELHRYNPNNASKIGAAQTGLDRAECMAISPDGKWLAIGGEEAWVSLFDARSMLQKKRLEAPGDDLIQRVAFSADSKQLMAGSIGDDVGIWDLDRLSEKPRQQMKGLSEWVRGVGFSADGYRCAGFDNEYKLIVWKTAGGTKMKEYTYEDKFKGDQEFWATAGVIGPDGTVLIGTREGELLHLTIVDAK